MAFWSTAAALLSLASSSAACPPAGHDRAALDALKTREFRIDDAAERQRLAIGLLACLGDPDPQLRDGIVYEALSGWMRAQLLEPATLDTLRVELLQRLTEARPASDPGFQRPFAALVLSELVRTDRLQPWMKPAQRAQVVKLATAYLTDESDLRGFDEQAGWRHGVAHAADVLLQLSANPVIDASAQQQLLTAIRSKINPTTVHFYIYGEPERLARPVLVMLGRTELDSVYWSSWFKQIAAPAPLQDWGNSYSSQAGLAQRHNVGAFLRAVLAGLKPPGQSELEVEIRGLLGQLSP